MSRQTVQAWYNEGLPRSPKAGQVMHFLAHREGYAAGSERERLERARTEKLLLENARRSGELMYTADALAVVTTLATDLGMRLDAVAGRLANEIPSITDAAIARSRVLEEHRSVRAGIADYLDKLARDRLAREGDREPAAPAAAENGRPVGRRKPRPAARKRRARAVS